MMVSLSKEMCPGSYCRKHTPSRTQVMALMCGAHTKQDPGAWCQTWPLLQAGLQGSECKIKGTQWLSQLFLPFPAKSKPQKWPHHAHSFWPWPRVLQCLRWDLPSSALGLISFRSLQNSHLLCYFTKLNKVQNPVFECAANCPGASAPTLIHLHGKTLDRVETWPFFPSRGSLSLANWSQANIDALNHTWKKA